MVSKQLAIVTTIRLSNSAAAAVVVWWWWLSCCGCLDGGSGSSSVGLVAGSDAGGLGDGDRFRLRR